MFVVYGKKTRTATVQTGRFYCAICHQVKDFAKRRVDEVPHIYFISLGDGSMLAEYIDCLACGTAYKVEVLNYGIHSALADSTGTDPRLSLILSNSVPVRRGKAQYAPTNEHSQAKHPKDECKICLVCERTYGLDFGSAHCTESSVIKMKKGGLFSKDAFFGSDGKQLSFEEFTQLKQTEIEKARYLKKP